MMLASVQARRREASGNLFRERCYSTFRQLGTPDQ